MTMEPLDALVIQVRVTPGARGKPRAAWLGDRLAVWLNVAPEKGRANKALQVLLAELFAVPPSAVTIVRGAASRNKVISIAGPRQWPAGCPVHFSAHSL
jgi:uncharacterized protein (TIGR00251 family)